MARYMRTKTVISRQIAGELVLFPIIPPGQLSGTAAANFYVLNASAEELWKRLASPVDSEELVSHLIAHFEVVEETARLDVASFLDDLREAGAIEPLTGNGGKA